MGRHRLAWAIAAHFAAAAILLGTLAPFNFASNSFRTVGGLLSVPVGPELSPDIAGNILLFFPLGFALTGYLHTWRATGVLAMSSVVVASLVFSYAIEVLQSFLPSRITSLSDVVSNGAGGAFGFVAYHLWRGENTGCRAAAYLAAVTLLSLPLQWSTTVRAWENDFPLTVGNEHTGDRPWQGQVFGLLILDRSVSARDVSHLRDGTASARMGGSVVALYDLRQACPCPDASGQLPPLVCMTSSDAPDDGEGMDPGVSHWFGTNGPATSVVERVKNTSRFTLALDAATANTRQWGPARVVSLSADPGRRRNLTIGQEGSDLVVRLRTTLNNGSRPPLVVPDVFSTRDRRHLVISYDGLHLVAYVDGAPHAMRLGMGAAAFAPLLARDPRAFPAYEVLYYTIVFMPFGLLVSRVGTGSGRVVARLATLGAATAACSFAFEAMLVMASGRVFSVWNIVAAFAAAAAGIATGQLAHSQFVAAAISEPSGQSSGP